MHPRNELRLLAGIAIDGALEVTAHPEAKELTESGWSSQEVVTNLDDAYSRLDAAVQRRDKHEILRITAELEELESSQDEYDVGVHESKKAKKDWDGNGKIESEKAEHDGVVDKAVKKSKKKKPKKKLTENQKFTGYAEWESEVQAATQGFVTFEDEGDDRLRAITDGSEAGYHLHSGKEKTVGVWDDEKGEGVVFESSYNYDPANHETWEDDEADPVNVSGDDDNTVWRALDKDKSETPSQLDALGNQSSEEHRQACPCPAALLTQLKDTVSGARDEADKWRNSYSRYETTKFYDDYANACEQLHDHLKAGTVGDMKKAQIHMSSLMGPMLHKIPDAVNDFVMRGGQNRSLKDHFTKVQGYPIEGPRNKLS